MMAIFLENRCEEFFVKLAGVVVESVLSKQQELGEDDLEIAASRRLRWVCFVGNYEDL